MACVLVHFLVSSLNVLRAATGVGGRGKWGGEASGSRQGRPTAGRSRWQLSPGPGCLAAPSAPRASSAPRARAVLWRTAPRHPHALPLAHGAARLTPCLCASAIAAPRPGPAHPLAHRAVTHTHSNVSFHETLTQTLSLPQARQRTHSSVSFQDETLVRLSATPTCLPPTLLPEPMHFLKYLRNGMAAAGGSAAPSQHHRSRIPPEHRLLVRQGARGPWNGTTPGPVWP